MVDELIILHEILQHFTILFFVLHLAPPDATYWIVSSQPTQTPTEFYVKRSL